MHKWVLNKYSLLYDSIAIISNNTILTERREYVNT